MRFLQWLLHQSERKDPIGNLACGLRDDDEKPHGNSNIALFEKHLRFSGASHATMEAFHQAVSEYTTQPKKRSK
jgi:hypothetical protein